MMRKILVLSALVSIACVFTTAQNSSIVTMDQWKVYAGYQYTALDSHALQEALNLEHQIDPSFPLIHFGNRQNLNGWNFGVQEDITKWFGVVIDAGGGYTERRILVSSIGGVNVSTRTREALYSFTGGPQFTFYRGANFQPFGRFLVGGGWLHSRTDVLENNVPVTSPFDANDAGVAYGGGLGTDVFFSRRIGIRVAADLLRTSFFGDTQNHVRASAGLVFRF